MTKLTTLTDSEKVEAVKKAIGGNKTEVRVVFDDFNKAFEVFEKARQAGGDSLPAYYPRAEDGSLDSTVFDQGTYTVTQTITAEDGTETTQEIERPVMQAAVAVVGGRGEKNAEGKTVNGIKALVLFPIPSTQALLESAPDWAEKVMEKEAAHVAFRALRNAESVEELEAAFNGMPRDVADYVTRHTAAAEIDTETFDLVWPTVRDEIKDKMPKLYAWVPPKAEVLRSIRSSAFAKAEHNELESRGFFVWLVQVLKNAAMDWKDKNGEPTPLETETLDKWLAERDTVAYTPKPKAELDESALDALKTELGF